MSKVKLRGVRLNTQIDGSEQAPWLVLSNSLGATLSMWDPQIEFLTQKYRVLRYDSRGHGASDTPRGPYSFDDLTGDVIALMDHFGIQKATFMGLSKGGMTGLGLALDHADRFDRVICADARSDAPDQFRAMWDERIAKVKAGGLAAIVDGTLASWMTADWHANNPAKSADIRQMVLINNPEGYIACCMALKDLDYFKRLGEISIPVLYVGGSNDMGASPDTMGAMADATPGGKYIEVAGAAHVANINAPEAFNDAIKSFLDL